MFRLFSTISALLLAAATLLASGCSHGGGINSSVLPAGLRAAQEPPTSDPFTARYSGSLSGGCEYGVCHFDLTGSGTGTFIHASTLTSTNLVCEHLPGLRWYDSFTIQSTRQPRDELFASVIGHRVHSQCYAPSKLLGKYTVTGGTGVFSNARGHGLIVIDLKSSQTFNAHLNGALAF